MNFTIDQSVLALLAKRADKLINTGKSKPATPILASAVLTARAPVMGQGGGLTVTAADASITYVGLHTADVTVPGTIAISAADLSKLAAVLPTGPVSVSVNDREKVTFRVERAGQRPISFVLPGLAPTEHPGTPEAGDAKTMTVDAHDLRCAIDYALTCAGPDDDRQGFGGVKVEQIGNAMVRFFGMDGLRLMWLDIPYDGEVGGGTHSKVPGRVLEQLRPMLDGVAGPVPLAISQRAFTATLPNVTITSRMLEADMPDYRQIVPTSFERTATVDRAEWLEAVRRAAVFADTGARVAAIRFDFAADSITMSASKTDAGASRVEVDAVLVGEPMAVGINVHHVTDALKAFGGQKVIVEIGNAMSLITFRDPDEAFMRFVCGPMRLTDGGS